MIWIFSTDFWPLTSDSIKQADSISEPKLIQVIQEKLKKSTEKNKFECRGN